MAPKGLIWELPSGDEPSVYLTFDDGPHPVATPLVLKQLEDQDAKASFFCIGKNVAAEPELFAQIQAAGHRVGNHSFNHLNGWKVEKETYLEDIRKADPFIPGHLFRPPYGRITRAEARALQQGENPRKVYMWTVLSGDFDTKISPQKCLANVLDHIHPGAIIVFHDSAKALPRLRYSLPFVLDYCHQQGWKMRGLPE
ncbi:MAG: polysaccharide deacetylase family protein [Bacteroidetes bacterium]|nr:polysaccharide deacetylase family protein [Bacteroidota bacterium]MBS1628698.1 polysaccharide deacetylase family protein [Bacteroidota bacterium]